MVAESLQYVDQALPHPPCASLQNKHVRRMLISLTGMLGLKSLMPSEIASGAAGDAFVSGLRGESKE